MTGVMQDTSSGCLNNPHRANFCHDSDLLQVMTVLSRLADKGLTSRQTASFQEAGTSAGQLLTSVASNPELASLLSQPAVREALAAIRTAPDPEAAVAAACEADPRVARALDLLEAAVAGGTGSSSSSRRGQEGPVIAVDVPQPKS
jgi:hypothetical protein